MKNRSAGLAIYSRKKGKTKEKRKVRVIHLTAVLTLTANMQGQKKERE